jgi:hypothetical protein
VAERDKLAKQLDQVAAERDELVTSQSSLSSQNKELNNVFKNEKEEAERKLKALEIEKYVMRRLSLCIFM